MIVGNNLVSVLILSYNNFQYLKESIDSVLSQTYPCIELVISDDASNDFSEEEIKKYIEENNKGNIVRYVINKNEENLGIPKNLNKAIKISTGEILVCSAADDLLYDITTIATIANYHKANKECLIAVGFIACYNKDFSVCLQYTPRRENIKFIVGEPINCFRILSSTGSFFPSPGMSFKRKLIEKYGYYDESYKLINDYSRFLNLTRRGCRIGFIDCFLIKYREGGVSSRTNDEEIKKIIDEDMRLIRAKEILPYMY